MKLSDDMIQVCEIQGDIFRNAQRDFKCGGKIFIYHFMYSHLAKKLDNPRYMLSYNPSSHKRKGYLKKACEILLRHKGEDDICGYVRNIGREGEEYHILTLKELKDTEVDMFTTVFIGNSNTKVINNKMVTPRGYKGV
jgi:precorrin-3B methylase